MIMRSFINTVDGSIWAFEDDGSDIFAYPNTPTTLIPYTPPPPTDAELLAASKIAAKQAVALFTTQIQKRLDDFAKTRGYDGILSACTYATSAVIKSHTEGQCCVDARDNTWSSAYAILADVEAGSRAMPTLEDVMLELPALEWPV